MKRFLSVLLAVVMLFTLAACGKKDAKSQMPASNVTAPELIFGEKLWSKAMETDMDNDAVKMHAYAVDALKELKVVKPDGTETVITADANKQVLCITADVEEIREKGYDLTHMGGKITVDNVIYYLKRLVVPKNENGAANVIFYAQVPSSVSPDTAASFKASVSLHHVSFEDEDDTGINRELPLRNMEVALHQEAAPAEAQPEAAQ